MHFSLGNRWHAGFFVFNSFNTNISLWASLLTELEPWCEVLLNELCVCEEPQHAFWKKKDLLLFVFVNFLFVCLLFETEQSCIAWMFLGMDWLHVTLFPQPRKVRTVMITLVSHQTSIQKKKFEQFLPYPVWDGRRQGVFGIEYNIGAYIFSINRLFRSQI